MKLLLIVRVIRNPSSTQPTAAIDEGAAAMAREGHKPHFLETTEPDCYRKSKRYHRYTRGQRVQRPNFEGVSHLEI